MRARLCALVFIFLLCVIFLTFLVVEVLRIGSFELAQLEQRFVALFRELDSATLREQL
jgi:hypothetical protein